MKVLAHLLKIKYLGQIPTKTIVGENMDYIPPCFHEGVGTPSINKISGVDSNQNNCGGKHGLYSALFSVSKTGHTGKCKKHDVY